MAGLAFMLQGEPLNPDGLPVVEIPPDICTYGTLLFTDPMELSNPWGPGIPSTVPNLAGGWAADATGSALAKTLQLVNGITTGLVERTPKGGLHVAHKKGAGTGNQTLSLGNQQIRDYVAANPSHTYYEGYSYTLTALPGAFTPAASQRLLGVPGTGFNDGFSLNLTGDRTQIVGYPVGATRILTTPAPVALGIGFAEAAWAGLTGTLSTSPTLILFHNAGANSPGLSLIHYSAIIEDCTASGRTPAQVSTLFKARHQQIRGIGGRYNGDTWTPPAVS
jgi:hypothetical protein